LKTRSYAELAKEERNIQALGLLSQSLLEVFSQYQILKNGCQSRDYCRRMHGLTPEATEK
jgi:hypothetical protein